MLKAETRDFTVCYAVYCTYSNLVGAQKLFTTVQTFRNKQKNMLYSPKPSDSTISNFSLIRFL